MAEDTPAGLVEEISWVSEEQGLPPSTVMAIHNMLEDGQTLPFIFRYRSYRLGGISVEQLQRCWDRIKQLLAMRKKKRSAAVAALPSLHRSAIWAARTPAELKTLLEATTTNKKVDPKIQDLVSRFLDDGDFCPFIGEKEKEVLVKRLGQEYTLTKRFQYWLDLLYDKGYIKVVKGKHEATSHGPIRELQPHLYLGVLRAKKTKKWKVLVTLHKQEPQLQSKEDVQAVLSELKGYTGCTNDRKRSLLESLARQALVTAVDQLRKSVLRKLKETSIEGAADMFVKNLKQVLLSRPVSGKVLMGWDPGFAHGCKLAVVDPKGGVVEYGKVLLPMGGKKVGGRDSSSGPVSFSRKDDEYLVSVLKSHKVDVIVVGNGVGSRESQVYLSKLLKTHSLAIPWIVVSEAGASVYSVSEAARKEFPSLPAWALGAVSLARRAQDPLSELIKIDPKHIGLGMYQHDIPKAQLDERLKEVISFCVSEVGVTLTTASPHLLSHVSGLNSTTAAALRAAFEAKAIRSRSDMVKVKGIGAKFYQACAGFIRIANSPEWLDNTRVHPESYNTAEQLLHDMGISKAAVISDPSSVLEITTASLQNWSEKNKVPMETIRQIIDSLAQPDRDPREDFSPPNFRSDVLTIKDVKTGQLLEGRVSSVTSFGCFVDLGLEKDALLHISKMHGLDVGVNDVLHVVVDDVDAAKQRVSLSFSHPPTASAAAFKAHHGGSALQHPPTRGQPASGRQSRRGAAPTTKAQGSRSNKSRRTKAAAATPASASRKRQRIK